MTATQPTTSSLEASTTGGSSASEIRDGAELQERIDRATGGVVELPAGRYVMSDSLRLRSGVSLKGDGQVVLVRAEPVESELLDIVGYGHREFRPRHPERFRVGMGVAMTDRRSGGFGTTVARIVAASGGTFFTDTPAARDYRVADGARVRNVFPLVAGYGVQDADVEGLVIEGDSGTASLLDGCRDAGVYLIGCRNVRLAHLEIRHYPGDAVSFQQCIDVYVQDCHLHHNAGHGLHPGSGSVRYVLLRNRVQSNGGCGIYYCLRTTHSICRLNHLSGNGAEGISIGERDTDHLVESNTVSGNGSAGIRLRRRVASGADRVVLRDNALQDNGVADRAAQIEIDGGVRQIRIENNSLSGGSGPAIRIGAGCDDVVAAGNRSGASALPASAVESSSDVQARGLGIEVGPAQLPPDGARHLGVGNLLPWVDRCV